MPANGDPSGGDSVDARSPGDGAEIPPGGDDDANDSEEDEEEDGHGNPGPREQVVSPPVDPNDPEAVAELLSRRGSGSAAWRHAWTRGSYEDDPGPRTRFRVYCFRSPPGEMDGWVPASRKQTSPEGFGGEAKASSEEGVGGNAKGKKRSKKNRRRDKNSRSKGGDEEDDEGDEDEEEHEVCGGGVSSPVGVGAPGGTEVRKNGRAVARVRGSRLSILNALA